MTMNTIATPDSAPSAEPITPAVIRKTVCPGCGVSTIGADLEGTARHFDPVGGPASRQLVEHFCRDEDVQRFEAQLKDLYTSLNQRPWLVDAIRQSTGFELAGSNSPDVKEELSQLAAQHCVHLQCSRCSVHAAVPASARCART